MRRWKKIKRKKRKNSPLKDDMKTLNGRVETMDKSLNLHGQCSRRNCLLIHAVKEKVIENTDEVVVQILEKEMQEKVLISNIDPIDLEKNKPEM